MSTVACRKFDIRRGGGNLTGKIGAMCPPPWAQIASDIRMAKEPERT